MHIDDYVTTLDRALSGPPGPRRDLVGEARDSLIDAAEAYQAEGVPPTEAERLAVEEFGEVAEIAPHYQEELTASAGRRLGALLFVTVPLTALMWWVIWRIFPMAPTDWATKPGWFLPAARALDILQMISGVTGALALVLLRKGRRPRRVTRALAYFVGVMLVLTLILSTALMYGSHGPTGFAAYPPGIAATVVSWSLAALQLYGAARCMSLTRAQRA
ncbi:permease prefix domain 1-containing protein [Nonomuraea sp. NPDC050556]|uniref:permease prefix domain 1-containing protein n=1 Tax=Nonomuraea sp. NPDC050556 TaxID=3364369 RepID=UPI00379B99C2